MAVPEMPAAAYLASIPPPGISVGVSGGGGEPRLARVVEVEAVDAKRLMLDSWLPEFWRDEPEVPPGGG